MENMKKAFEKIKKYKNIEIICFVVILLIISCVMLFYIDKKQGFHEDEMFTYGSSNFKYDNMFQPYAREDDYNKVMFQKVIDKNSIINTIKNRIYYLANPEQFEIDKRALGTYTPIWKTKEEAHEYLTIQKDDIFNYVSVYYNQTRDIHPPLLYFFVHTVSIFFFETFSKYIVFIVNMIFFLLTCFTIRKILLLINRKRLVLITLILYGFSMGAISTVMFHRMYMLLTCFALMYLYITLKIYKSDFAITKKVKWQLIFVTILGFLTQYYFCIYIAAIALVTAVILIKKRKFKELRKYILYHIIAAIIGLAVYPGAINDIFYSYRGIPALEFSGNYSTSLVSFIEHIFSAFSIPNIIGYIISALLLAGCVYLFIKKDKKKWIAVFVIPVIIYILAITKMSPFLVLRYEMAMLPIIAIIAVLGIDSIIKNKKISIGVLLCATTAISVYGLATKEPQFLYKNYAKYLEIAKENSHDNFVYVGNTMFNHVQSMLEFATYDKSLILEPKQLELLSNNEELMDKQEFILSIKKHEDVEDVLNKVLEYSGYNNYELLFDDDGETACIIYKIKR